MEGYSAAATAESLFCQDEPMSVLRLLLLLQADQRSILVV